MSLFSKLIRCSLCNKNHKLKRQRSNNVYCCSTYDKLGKAYCQRLPVHEKVLIDYLELRNKEKPTEEYIQEKIDYILVSPNRIEIFIKDESPIIATNRLIDLGATL
jgi:hypothetical protein